ncbi:hypothetical protein B0A55_04931 [Friedmanniomyces simplex]|uniref:Uncharacterized protein n=1 Tax=Friedmanniomyces simplex TaxID=329884 RepID=A0A4U0XM68_9PEZI|nr:hypothetical protein B0A55_04931 [Friedmanniomyces simplex]
MAHCRLRTETTVPNPRHCLRKTGDGFEPSELEITYRFHTPRQNRKRLRPPALTYSALQLCGGPLPEVAFKCGADELQLEASGGPHHVSAQFQKEEEHPGLQNSSTQRSRRRVSFSGRDDFIVAQLSSVTAPRRHQSDSEDEEEDEESDIDGDESQIDDAEAIVEGFAGDEEHGDHSELDASETEQAATAKHIGPRNTLMQAQRRPSIRFTQIEDIEEDELPGGGGVVQHTIAVRPPALSNKKRRLIEVCEAIEDVPDTATQDPREMITTWVNRNHSDGATRTRRTRSILKNSTPFVPGSTFHPEDTAANTRRNSVVVAAAEQLDLPDPGRHIIVRRRRSNYSGKAQIQIPNSERAVPETSPEPPNYTNGSQLAVLRRTSENVWTSSQNLPTAAPRGLKALTRNVSREHGTLSQSGRGGRRPSLPFQSPSKALA